MNDGTKLYEYRRGVKRCVSISSLAFSTCSNYLCCSSNTETVHVFKLDTTVDTTNDNKETAKDDWIGYISKTVTSYLPSYLPSQVTDVFTQGRAFASAVLPVPGLRNNVAIATIQKSLR